MAISGGELLLNLLEACGVEYIFCSPGTEWAPLWEGLLKRRGRTGLKYINCRHETLAVSAAQGYAEVTGRLPAVLLHSGVGLLMGSIAMRNALSARAPMLILSGQTCEHCGDKEVGPQGWQWLGVLSDIGGPAALVEKYVKWHNSVGTREGLIDSVIRGSRIALAAPRGPVYLSVPSEILLKTGADVKLVPPSAPDVTRLPAADDLREVARRLVRSENPIIIADRAGRVPGAADALAELAATLAIPVFDTILHFASNISRDNPLYQRQITPAELKQADTVLVVACNVPWYPPAPGPGDKAKIIVLDEDTAHPELPYWGYRADIALNAPVEATLTALTKTVRAEKARRKSPEKLYRQRLAFWRQKHDEMIAGMNKLALAVRGNKPIAARWFFHAAQKALPAGVFVLDETLTHTHLLHHYLAAPGQYIKPAYGGLGVGMGAALGVKIARPDRPVVYLAGDGTFNYNPVLAGLGLAQEYGLPFLVIILDNGGYMAMKRSHQRLYPQGRAVRENAYLGVDIAPAPDYVKVAEAFGAYGEKVTQPEKIAVALKRAWRYIERGKAALLDVVVADEV